MSSFILNTLKNDLVNNWVKTNAAGSLKGKPADSWRAYLAANGGTGKTLHDMEMSFLAAAGATGRTLHDRWNSYLAGIPVAGGKAKEKARNRYK